MRTIMNKIIPSNRIKESLKINIRKSYGKDTADRVIHVINGYGKRSGFWSHIGGVFYRIWNAVKAIFNSSDWQLARKAIAHEFDQKIDFSKTVAHQKADIILRTFTMYTHCKASSGEQLKKKLLNLQNTHQLNIAEFDIQNTYDDKVMPDFETLSNEELIKMCIERKIDERGYRERLIMRLKSDFKKNA